MSHTASTSRSGKTRIRLSEPITLSHSPRMNASSDFLELTYQELEERNLRIKHEREEGRPQDYFREVLIEELKNEAGIKAAIICFSDLEGKLHMLDYNKKFLLESHRNLTFDGSSIKGFTPQHNSDLRLILDWSSFKWLPADVFGHGKVLMFANVHDQDGTPYISDYRSNLSQLVSELKEKHGYRVLMAPEIEGFLMNGEGAEQNFREAEGFSLVTEGGYFNALPQDDLRQFIDRLAESTRALGFENEKDHPEVAPSQFEMNYKYTDVLHAADQILIYKIVAKQIAKSMGMTASFLPKPVTSINGSGMHSNMSLQKDGKNIFYDKKGEHGLSMEAHNFLTGVLYYGMDLCLAINSSVNSYRRLDPAFEAPNEIKVSPSDRGSMIRIPLANEKSARIEVRTVAPDANPYLAYFLILKAGLKGMHGKDIKTYKEFYNKPIKKLPASIQPAINAFKKSEFIKEVMPEENYNKYIELKQEAADRSPVSLGIRVKNGEVWYHHEVRNQVLWNRF